MSQDGFSGQTGFGGGSGSSSLAANTVADWSLSLVRYFLVDSAGGLDSNRGYIDAAAGSTLTPTGLAKQTIAGLLAILPRSGAGRTAVILIANASASGTTYAETLDLSGCHGYARILVRGSTDLSNSTTDRVTCGFMQGQAGPNGDGYWEVASVTGTSAINVASGLSTTGAGLEGWRVRFSSGALSGTCRPIWRNSATAIEWDQDATAPATNVQFYTEKPGVRLSRYLAPTGIGTIISSAGTYIQTVTVVGIAVTSSTAGAFQAGHSEHEFYCGCEVATDATTRLFQTSAGARAIELSKSYLDETNTTRAVGMGLRCAGGYFLAPMALAIQTGGFAGVMTAALSDPTNINLMSSTVLFVAGGTIFRRGVEVQCIPVSGRIGGFPLGGFFGNGSSSSVRKSRIINGPLVYRGGGLDFNGIEWEGCTVPGFKWNPVQATFVVRGGPTTYLDGLSNGSGGGNTDVGIDVTDNYGGELVIGTKNSCSLSGTVGEIRLAGSALATYADLAKTNVVDKNRNNVIGTGGSRVGQCTLYTQKSAAGVVGKMVRSNNTTGQAVLSLADTLANANRTLGVAVTSPAADANGYYVNYGVPYVEFDGTATVGNTAYVDEAQAGLASATPPPAAATNAELRVGKIFETSGTGAYVAWHKQDVSILSAGGAGDA